MAVPELHFFAANDVNGATILEVPVTEDYVERIVARPALRELGYMAFRFSRQVGFAIFDSGAFQPETFVRLLLPDVSTTRYVWGCFLNDRVQQLVARVKAGENFDFGGPGPKHYLSRAILWDEQFFGSGYNIDLANGVYRWKETASAGRVLTSLINDDANNTIAQFLPDLTASFGNSVDSAGNAWANDIAGTDEFELRIGDDFLTNLFKIEDSGDLETTMNLGTVASPTLELEAWQAYGRDLSGPIGAATVHFKEAVNILGDLSVAGASQRKASHALVEGLDASYGHAVRSSWDPGEYAKAVGISHDTTKNENVLDRYGLAWLRRQANNENEILVPHYPGFNQAAGLYFPGEATTSGHYWLGDTVSLTTGGDSGGTWTPLDYRSEDQRVMAITMEMRSVVKDGSSTEAALSWNVIAELNVERGSDTVPQGGSSAKGNCNCPALCHSDQVEVETSTAWKLIADEDDLAAPANWHTVAFDDSAYASAAVVSDGAWFDTGSDRWIWSADNDHQYLWARELVDLDVLPVSVELDWMSDGSGDIYVNGTLVATGLGGYTSIQTVSIPVDEFVVGDNVLAVHAGDPVAGGGHGIYGVFRFIGEGSSELVGTEARAARCDHQHLIETLPTAEGNADLVLVPDGTGGVEWAAVPGGGVGTLLWFNVTDPAYGAVGDGINDDTAEINLAIAAMNTAGGGVLYFPEGTYLVSAALTTLTVPGIVMGDGIHASIVNFSSATAHLFTSASTDRAPSFRDMSLINTATTPTAGSAIRVSSGGNYGNYARLRIENFWVGIRHEDGSAWGAEWVTMNSIRKYGFHISNSGTPDEGDWSLDNTAIAASTHSPDAAIRIDSSGGGKITNLKVNGSDPATGYNHGIDLAIAGSDATSILLVANSSIENVRGDGLHVSQAGTATYSHISFVGNQVNLIGNNSGKAVSIVAEDTAAIDHVVIKSNNFSTNGTARTPIQLTKVYNASITGNLLTENFEGQLPYSNTTSTGVEAFYPGAQLDYVEFTSNVAPTATVEASANTVVTANACTFDGQSGWIIEFYCSNVRPDVAAESVLRVWLFDGSSSIGRMGIVTSDDAGTLGANTPLLLRRQLTPTAGAHTYSIRATVGAGTGSVNAGAGGAGNVMPGYIRIVKA